MTISGVMIVKNEQRCIKRCIDSYKRIVNEVVVVDTGSTDDTVKIAESLGARVCFFEWNGSFSDAKNYAIEQATGDWIIFLDADEFFRPGDDKRLYRIIMNANRQNNLNFLQCWLRNVIEEPDGTFKPADGMVHLRVFKNRPNIRYVNDIHEYIRQADGDFTTQNIPEDQVVILHDGYSVNRGEAKAGRNLPMLYASLETAGVLSNTYFYIGQAHAGLDNYDFAFHYFLLHSDMHPMNVYGIYSHLLEKSAIGHLPNCNILNEFNARCAHKRFPGHPTAYFLSGLAHHGSGKMRLAAEDFEKAITLKRTHDFSDEYSQNRLDASYNIAYSVIAEYYDMEGSTQKALDFHIRALTGDSELSNTVLYSAVRFSMRNNCQESLTRAMLPVFARMDGKSLLGYLEVLSQHRPDILYISLLDIYLRTNRQNSFHMYIMTMVLGEYAVAGTALLNLLDGNRSEKLSSIALVAAVLSEDADLIRRAAEICGGDAPSLMEALIFEPRPLRIEEHGRALMLLEEMNRFGRCDGYIKLLIDKFHEAGDLESLLICFNEIFGMGCYELACYAADKALGVLDAKDKRAPALYSLFAEPFYFIRKYERSVELILKAAEGHMYNDRVREFGFMLSRRLDGERSERLQEASELAGALLESAKRSVSGYALDDYDGIAKDYLEKRLEAAADDEIGLISSNLGMICNRQGSLERAYELYTDGKQGELLLEDICPVCKKKARVHGVYKLPHEFVKRWYRCGDCGHIFTRDVREGEGLMMPYYLEPRCFARICEIVELLEQAEQANLLITAGNFGSYAGMEKELAEAAEGRGYKLTLIGNVEESTEIAYDAVISAYPLGAVEDAEAELLKLTNMLKTSGRLYLAFADNECEEAKRERDTDPELRNAARRHYFRLSSLETLLEKHGLKAERQISRLSPRSCEVVITKR